MESDCFTDDANLWNEVKTIKEMTMTAAVDTSIINDRNLTSTDLETNTVKIH